MTVIGADTAPDGGCRPIHRFLVPNGATISIPKGAMLLGTANGGTPVVNIAAVYSSAMVWQVWLGLAFGHLQDTKAARTEAMMWVTDRPTRRNETIGAFASVASGILHRVADPHIKIDPASPLYQQ